MLSRREVLKAAGVAAVGGPVLLPTRAAAAEAYELPKLPYPADALEPHIDARTMELHHAKHHATYVKNLNDALAGTALAGKPLEQVLGDLTAVPDANRAAARNNGGGHWNHTLFWGVMRKPGGPAGPKDRDLAAALDASFGGLDGFKKRFKQSAVGRFGSGWAWLVPGGADGKPLSIASTPNQDNPLMDGKPAPVLGVDVWEHAYYLKYQNKRADYVDAWFHVVDWDAVAAHFADRNKRG